MIQSKLSLTLKKLDRINTFIVEKLNKKNKNTKTKLNNIN